MANLTIDNLTEQGKGHESDDVLFHTDEVFDTVDSETMGRNAKSRSVLVIDDTGSITRMYAESLAFLVDNPEDIYIVGPSANEGNLIPIKEEDSEAAMIRGQRTARWLHAKGKRPALAVVDGLREDNRLEEVLYVLIRSGVSRIVVASADDQRARVDAIKSGPHFTHQRRSPQVEIFVVKKPFTYVGLKEHIDLAYKQIA